MEYRLEKANKKDIELLINYKIDTIIKYCSDEKELNRINNYVKENIKNEYQNYNIIKVDGHIIGCISVTIKDNNKLIEEIYIEEKYRNHGIGKSIIKSIINRENEVYLWVYKLNKKAISLYNRLGFKIEKETKTRYFMKCEKK